MCQHASGKTLLSFTSDHRDVVVARFPAVYGCPVLSCLLHLLPIAHLIRPLVWIASSASTNGMSEHWRHEERGVPPIPLGIVFVKAWCPA